MYSRPLSACRWVDGCRDCGEAVGGSSSIFQCCFLMINGAGNRANVGGAWGRLFFVRMALDSRSSYFYYAWVLFR